MLEGETEHVFLYPARTLFFSPPSNLLQLWRGDGWLVEKGGPLEMTHY